MVQILIQYSLFLAETITLILAFLALLVGVLTILSGSSSAQKNRIQVTSINEKFDSFRLSLNKSLLPKKEFQKLAKEKKKQKKGKKGQKRVFILNFHGDIKASAVENLREEITAILMTANQGDEILLRLESSGGMVHSYGLASSQLARIKDKNIKLTVAVDKIAASGGYMMACIADTLIAAQFAVIGSIGVIAQLPNFNRLLKEKKIDFEQITAGEYKRTLTMFGKNSEKNRKKLREELDDTHNLFKEFVLHYRRDLDIDLVATGEHWFGQRALALKLVDRIGTSDDYLLEKSKDYDLFEVKYEIKRGFMEKIPFIAESLFNRLLGWVQTTKPDM